MTFTFHQLVRDYNISRRCSTADKTLADLAMRGSSAHLVLVVVLPPRLQVAEEGDVLQHGLRSGLVPKLLPRIPVGQDVVKQSGRYGG